MSSTTSEKQKNEPHTSNTESIKKSYAMKNHFEREGEGEMEKERERENFRPKNENKIEVQFAIVNLALRRCSIWLDFYDDLCR